MRIGIKDNIIKIEIRYFGNEAKNHTNRPILKYI